MKYLITSLVASLVLLLVLGAQPLSAAVTLESFTFAHEADKERFKHLIGQLRCLVCQNQSLLDSDAELAHDLRAEVYEMMTSGRSDQEITTFLVDRYGDFVLYNPPIKPSTYLLWFGPFVLLAIAALLLLRAVRRQKWTPQAEFSSAEQKRLQEVLGRADTDKDPRA
jgi:cytochrome c-type biogenesis protein CcmH